LAVRLQLKLGAVTEQDRLPDSPDTVVVVEPSVGSVGRTKGNLYLLVTSRSSSPKAREATRVVADTIRNEYYYDESAGIRQCLTKVLVVANKRLSHQRDKYGLGHQPDGAGPIGVAVAVVRGRELYVATVGPAEAYLIRQARLSTLPDPNGERGMPVADLEPEVWRGELSVGDSLCLVSANVVARVGTDTLKDALVTLHPQSAIEHIHARFVAADGSGSDGAFAFEATEVGATQKARTLVPVRPDEPLAGAPDRSPIPLADSVTAGAAAIGASANRARDAAGNGFQRFVRQIQDRLPRRRPGNQRTSTASSRMETQRRAAVALLAFVAVAGTLVLGMYAVGGQRQPTGAIKSMTAAQQAFEAAKEALDSVSGPGIDLVNDDPKRALQLLTTAYQELDKAEKAGYPVAQLAPLRKTAMAGLDRLYKVVNVASTDLFTFPVGETPVSLTGLVRGSDGAPYVLDAAGKTVWRIDLAKKTATPVATSGQKASGTKVADPKLITTGGPDVLILDSKNVLWRWRPADAKGKGTLVRIKTADSSSWGNDILDIATFVANFDAAFYKLYVVDPSEQNILVLSPANDGSGYPSKPTRRLPTDRPVDGITDLLIDGDIYVAENGGVARLIPATGWQVEPPQDVTLRPVSRYTLLSSPDRSDGSSSRRTGTLYAFDEENHRLVAFSKADGRYLAQYQLAGGASAWAGLKGMTVLVAPDETVAPTLWWISATGLQTVTLEAVPDGSGASPAPSASPSGQPSSAPSAGTAKPAKTAKP
jgi:outer membrane protein assembly factor BamB